MSPQANLLQPAADTPETPGQAVERERIEALESFDVLDTPCEEVFDRITRIAQASLGTPIVLISLVDSHRQWFKSCIGLDATETPREISFCTHAIERETVMVVEDAAQNPRFAGNPLVTGAPHIRFYAGAPLITAGGHRIGTLCAIDTKPRKLSEGENKLLVDLAAMVVHELELRRIAGYDVLTGACSRGNFFGLAEKELGRARRYNTPFSIFVMDLDHFKNINDGHGHAVGDMALKAAVHGCQDVLRAHDVIGRLGGEEFAVLLPLTDREGAARVAERVRRSFEAMTLTAKGEKIAFTASFGVCAPQNLDDTVTSIIARADAALYEAKDGGRNRVVVTD